VLKTFLKPKQNKPALLINLRMKSGKNKRTERRKWKKRGHENKLSKLKLSLLST